MTRITKENLNTLMSSTFQLNALVNNASGNFPRAYSSSGLDQVFTSQLNIIRSEVWELLTALKTVQRHGNTVEHLPNTEREALITEIRDGIADVIVTTDGMRHRLVIPHRTLTIKLSPSLQEFIGVDLDDLIGQLNREHETLTSVPAFAGESLELVHVHSLGGLEWPVHDAWRFLSLCYNLAYSAAFFFDIPLLEDHFAVFWSNMSKFDTSLEDAKKTEKKYEDLGVAVYIETVKALDAHHNLTTFFIVKSSKDQVVGGKDYPAGKFLKSINFKEPVFIPLLKNL